MMGGFSGGNMERPALQALLADIRAGRIDIVIVYKVDRLTRSLADFARLVEIFDAQGASFVSVTQQFNTTGSMGRLTLNVLLSFAQFEREVIGERIRDKIAASKRKGMWMGGVPPFGYRAQDRKLVVADGEAEIVRAIFRRYAELGSVRLLKEELEAGGINRKSWTSAVLNRRALISSLTSRASGFAVANGSIPSINILIARPARRNRTDVLLPISAARVMSRRCADGSGSRVDW